MPLKNPEKILANIVLLPGESGTLNITSNELQQIFRDPGLQVQTLPVPGQPNAQLQITSLREQIVFALQPSGQIIVEDKSADLNPRGRVAEIVNGVVELLATKNLTKYRAYGFNFHMTFDTPGEKLAAEFIAERFLVVDKINQRGNIEVAGGGVRLYFNHSNASCDFRLEPHQNKVNSPNVFASINYNFDLGEKSLPPPDLLKSDFLGKWQIFEQLVEGLVQ